MGKRKKLAAEARKAALKTQYFAKLKDVPSSPRKMRYVVDLIRGMEVNKALGTLKFSSKAASAWAIKRRAPSYSININASGVAVSIFIF